MEIKRDRYLQKLINYMHIDMVKIITGIRRSGKSYLLGKIFVEYLKSIAAAGCNTNVDIPEKFVEWILYL